MTLSGHSVENAVQQVGTENQGFTSTSVADPFRTFVVLPQRGAHWSLTTLRDKLIEIGAKVIPHGRYVAFQMAEVAASHYLFAHILGLNSDLKAPPAKPQCKNSRIGLCWPLRETWVTSLRTGCTEGIMPEYLAPGVYVEEINAGPRPIVAVPISTTAFVGATVKGPLNEATVVQSFATYSEVFGPASSASPVSLAVLQFFANGGREAVVVQVTPSGRRRGTLPSPRELIGDAKAETGIHALANREPFGLLLTPDTSGMRLGDAKTVAKAALKFCEKHRVFYIFDVPQGRSKCGSVRAAVDWAQRSKTIRHPSAAVYFPRLSIPDPSGKADSLLVPPSGAVAGLYARTDAERGVWKTPAGRKARLYGVDGAEIDLTDADIELLQHASINPLRSFAGQGIVSWDARTFEPAGARTEWRYVPVRRVALLIEQSLQQGLQWTVFEPNGESLWAQIRLGVSSFMNLLFRAGAFQGAHAREAYMVKCGRETMTQGDIEKGHIVLLVGFAPLKPAEFVVLRFALEAGFLY